MTAGEQISTIPELILVIDDEDIVRRSMQDSKPKLEKIGTTSSRITTINHA